MEQNNHTYLSIPTFARAELAWYPGGQAAWRRDFWACDGPKRYADSALTQHGAS
ncbi:MAG TPA: hypothetical protein VIX20_05730 [Ktedonobacteraceae bacterium]